VRDTLPHPATDCPTPIQKRRNFDGKRTAAKANQTWKALADAGAKTPQEMRPVLERLFTDFPSARQVKCEPVSAGGVKAEWITAPNAAADRAILYLHGGGTSWALSTRIAN
jgi:hypothetical protein